MRRAWISTLIKYLLGVAVLAYVLYSNWHPKPGQPGPGLSDALSGSINFGYLLLAAACIAPAVLLTFVRWYVLARALNLPLPPREALRLGLVGYFFNTLLPGSVGGDLVKAAALVRSQDRRTAAVASVLFDRVIGLGGLALLVALSGGYFWLVGDPVLADQPALLRVVRSAAIIVAVSGAAWFVLGYLPGSWSHAIGHWLGKVPKLGGILFEAWCAVWLYRKRPGAVCVAVALTVAGHLLNVFVFHFAARVFAPNFEELPSLSEHLVFVPVGLAIRAFFPAPGGAGGAEFSFGKLYEMVGRPGALGVLGSLAVLICTWALGGLAYFVAQMISVSKRSEPTRLPEPARDSHA